VGLKPTIPIGEVQFTGFRRTLVGLKRQPYPTLKRDRSVSDEPLWG